MLPASVQYEPSTVVLTELANSYFGSDLGNEARKIWNLSAEELSGAVFSLSFFRNYAEVSSEVTKLFGFSALTKLIDAVGYLKTHAGVEAAKSLVENVSVALIRISDADNFAIWLSTICQIADVAPKQVAAICSKSHYLLSKLDAIGFSRWVSSGETSTAGDADRIEHYFSMLDEASRQIIELEAGTVRLADIEKILTSLPMGLWKQSIIIRAADFTTSEIHVRTSFDDTIIRMPSSFDGFSGYEAKSLFKAAITHIGAHIEYSGERWKPMALKPIQIAITSILEDTRVEILAAKKYPGLLRLWQSFHTVSGHAKPRADNDKNCACNVVADNTPTTNNLLTRLARILIDENFVDDNPWVQKGRKMFLDAGPHWEDPDDIRRIGVLLGNDLGQMRLQFNSKTYIVEPAYRDDNLGLWDFGEPSEPSEEELDVVTASMRIEHNEEQSSDIERHKQQANESEFHVKSKPNTPDEDKGIPICKLPEWDYLAASLRPNWVTIMECKPPTAPAHIISRLVDKHANVAARIDALVCQSKVGQTQRLKRQREGDRLDIDACIQHRIDTKAGQNSDIGLFETATFSERDLSVLVLLDISESTKDFINGTATSVFHLERDAAALLAHAMDGMGDPFAIHAFCSNGRRDLRYFHIKNFGTRYNDQSKSRLAGMRPGLSTRMGGALRYASTSIGAQSTKRKLILVVTDGEPSDIDVTDPNYLIEDTRKAVMELAGKGIDVFAVGLEGAGSTALPRIFGQRNTVQIQNLASLPERLPMIYFRLVA